MDVAVIGVNHHLAPIQIREKVSFTDSQKIEAINVLLDQDINEIVILSTCNRSEIYIHANTIDEKINVIKNFYEEFFHDDEIKNFLFSKTGERAMGHLFEVASGLDSIVLGEDQILGQVKKAHEFSMQLGASKKYFNKLFREAIMTAKEIKNTTKISEQPLSISYIAIKLLKEKIGSLKGKNALVIGYGKMSKLAITYLNDEQVNEIYVANRSHGKVQDIGDRFTNVMPILYENRYDVLNDVDLVITATASPHVILKLEHMPTIDHKICMMDIALPRDIDPAIKKMNNIELYDIDDLKKIHEENDNKRNELALIGRQIIDRKIEEFLQWLELANIDPTIQSLNEKCLEIKSDSLDYLFKKINLDAKERKLIDRMMESALKRLIREPIINLKQIDNKHKRDEYIKLIEELFDI